LPKCGSLAGLSLCLGSCSLELFAQFLNIAIAFRKWIVGRSPKKHDLQ
jgi:hypothetical protein